MEPDTLTLDEIHTMKIIRESIPKIDNKTIIQKTIPAGDIDAYLNNGWNTVRGYVARYDDVSKINEYLDVVESSRLDYCLNDGTRPFPDDGNAYGYIKFKTKDADKISIPYGYEFGGTNIDGAPCMRNGFTGSRNGKIVPEWKVGYREELRLLEGSELHEVKNDIDKIVGIYDDDIGRFIPVS